MVRLALAGALALAALPAPAAPVAAAIVPAQVVVPVQPQGQQAQAPAAQAGQPVAPGQAQTVRPEPVVEPGATPPAQTVGVAGVPPKPDQAR